MAHHLQPAAAAEVGDVPEDVVTAAVGVAGAAQVEALDEVAVQLVEPLVRRSVLDALRRHVELERASQPDGRLDDGQLAVVLQHAMTNDLSILISSNGSSCN